MCLLDCQWRDAFNCSSLSNDPSLQSSFLFLYLILRCCLSAFYHFNLCIRVECDFILKFLFSCQVPVQFICHKSESVPQQQDTSYWQEETQTTGQKTPKREKLGYCDGIKFLFFWLKGSLDCDFVSSRRFTQNSHVFLHKWMINCGALISLRHRAALYLGPSVMSASTMTAALIKIDWCCCFLISQAQLSQGCFFQSDLTWREAACCIHSANRPNLMFVRGLVLWIRHLLSIWGS